MIQQFFIVKPEFLDKEDEISAIMLANGWTTAYRIQKTLDIDTVKAMYDDCKQIYIDEDGDLKGWEAMCKYMSSSDCICLAACNENTENPIADGVALKEYIRKMVPCCQTSYKNLFHSASSIEERDWELEHCMGIVQ